MSQPLQYSEWELSSKKTKNKKNRTYKKRSPIPTPPPTQKVKNFLEAMDSEQTMSDFKGNENKQTYPAYPQKPEPLTKTKNNKDIDEAIESFTQLSNDTPPQRNNYKQYVPYYTNVENSSQLNGSRNELLQKLNYMIHLLEEQQEDKTSNVAEELILYLFLGIFVIFIVDSFARAGKYTR